MGWADCGYYEGRPIGYGTEATCDFPGCEAEIDRGLSYVCGRMHGGDNGCGGYFCSKHLSWSEIVDNQVCVTCCAELEREAKTGHVPSL